MYPKFLIRTYFLCSLLKYFKIWPFFRDFPLSTFTLSLTLTKFVSPVLKLHNQYCHNLHVNNCMHDDYICHIIISRGKFLGKTALVFAGALNFTSLIVPTSSFYILQVKSLDLILTFHILGRF